MLISQTCVSLSRNNICRFCKRGFASKGTLETHETLQCVQLCMIFDSSSALSITQVFFFFLLPAVPGSNLTNVKSVAKPSMTPRNATIIESTFTDMCRNKLGRQNIPQEYRDARHLAIPTGPDPRHRSETDTICRMKQKQGPLAIRTISTPYNISPGFPLSLPLSLSLFLFNLAPFLFSLCIRKISRPTCLPIHDS